MIHSNHTIEKCNAIFTETSPRHYCFLPYNSFVGMAAMDCFCVPCAVEVEEVPELG